MTFLPIVDRELRVAARRGATYWARVIAALFALIIAAGVLVLAQVGRQFIANQLGPILFGIFSWLGFIFVSTAGVFLTSDCLSEEKREGTLGLLFLTDLRGYDVVSGKLLATSLRAAYGLLAAVPVIALAFLLGGVTGAQLWRLTLVLGNTLFFSLAAGLLVSSLSRDAQKAMNGTLMVCAVFLLLLPFTDWLIAGFDRAKFVPRLSFASPYFAFSEIVNWRGHFWNAMAVTHAIAWVFLILSCFYAPRAWHEKAAAPVGGVAARAQQMRYGSPARRSAFRRRLLEGNPIRWLAARDFWMARVVKIALAIATGLFVAACVTDNRLTIGVSYGILPLLSLVFGLWVASSASRFFVDAAHTGAMELLLVSPVGVPQIVHGQWWALLRGFLLPAILLLAMKAMAGVIQIFETQQNLAGSTAGFNFLGYQIISVASGVVLFATGVLATAWFGMWMGMTSSKVHLAVIKTLVFVKVLPWFVLMFGQGMLMIGVGMAQWPFWVPSLIVGILSVVLDFGFLLFARRQLLTRLREKVTHIAPLVLVTKPPPLPVAAIGNAS